jgi:hypothetical protein
MTNYLFKTSEFGLTAEGIHLLRSGFNYQTIRFSEIYSIEIKRGKELNNWLVIFVIGMILLLPGVYVSVGFVLSFLFEGFDLRASRLLLLLFIPVVGAYFIFTSLRTGLMLCVKYGADKSDRFPLRKISQKNELTEFRNYLKNNLGHKAVVKEHEEANA